MENTNYKKLLKFYGDHSTLIGLRIMNNLLKLVTLGMYYPWARVAMLKYMYGETEFMGSRFVFHGTGKEMFIGFVKAIGLFIVLYVLLFIGMVSQSQLLLFIGIIVFYIGFLLIIPLAVHSSYRYRLSRTSWRGIHFGYRGKAGEFLKLFVGNTLLTLVTFGLYSSWFQVAMKRYIYGHIRFGNVEARFDGQGVDLFIIRLKGGILSVLTLGIYFFWFIKDLIAFEMDNLKIVQNGKEINLRSTMTGGKMFSLIVVNYLIILCTLGIGTGIAINRATRVLMENIEFDSEIDADNVMQTEDEYKDATGDDLAGMLDLSIF